MKAGTQYITLRGVKKEQMTAQHFLFGQHEPPVNALIPGADGNDELVGDAGGNTLDGGAGADVMEGRTGDDTYLVDDKGDVVKELADGGYDTVKSSTGYTLPDEVEALELVGRQAVHATGNAKANRILGNEASNVIDGKGDADLMIGRKGNDTYVVDHTLDRVVEYEGEGTDTVRSSVSFTLGQHLENLMLTGSDAINGAGNALNNRLTGNAADNRLLGGAGNDWLDGGAGNDYLAGGAGSDTYRFGRGSGYDTIFNRDSGRGKDVLQFDESVNDDQLWFRRQGDDLEVSIVGTQDVANIRKWYADKAFRLDEIRLSDRRTLTDGRVDQLVAAMAAFAPPAAGQTSLPADYRTTLAPVLAANWQ